MNDSRARRLKAIAEIVRAGTIASQEEVTDRLAGLGFAVTQATISRDLDQLGAVKVKRGGMMAYALPDQIGERDWPAGRLERILAEWVLSVEASGSMLVVKTPPGSAQIVAHAIDGAALAEISGTVSGDDTLFVAVRDGWRTSEVADRFRAMVGQP